MKKIELKMAGWLTGPQHLDAPLSAPVELLVKRGLLAGKSMLKAPAKGGKLISALKNKMKAMKRISINAIAALTLLMFASHAAGGAELSRPAILVDQKERAAILEKINKYDEMRTAYNDLKALVDKQVATHEQNPSVTLDAIPKFGNSRKHTSILDDSVDAGGMFFLTGDEAYARLAADILNVYVQGILKMDPDRIAIAQLDFFMDSRVVYRQIGVTYDFIAPFLSKPGSKVYDREAKTYVAYRSADTQEAIKRLARFGLKHWAANSNHPLLEAPGILYNIMAIDDSQDRDQLVDLFVKGTQKGNGLIWARDTLLENGGHWPETPTYSGFFGGILGWMDVVDRVYPHYQIFDQSRLIFTAFEARKLFNYPDGREAVAFGDSRRGGVVRFHTGTYQALIKIARRVGFKEIEKELQQKCRGDLETYLGSVNAFVPQGLSSLLSYDRVDQVEGTRKEYQTAEIKHAGVVIQNNLNVPDKRLHGLMCYAGGAHYVHSQLSGLDLELYGAGLVMGGVAGDMSSPSRRGDDINRHYYRIYAGHNTVIVNGESKGTPKGSWKSDGMLYMDRTVTEAMEPAPLSPAITKDFTFSSQRLNDSVNNCLQQRMVSIVRTGPESGYYFDLFRSVSKQKNKYADYIYHNVGDTFTLSSQNGNSLSLTAQEKRYPSTAAVGKDKNEYEVLFPGWHYFKNVNVSTPTAEPICGTFTLAGKNKYMHVAMPGGSEREYTAAEAPPILEVEEGYDKKNARVLSIRQAGEAWNRPFIVVYEPSTNAKPTVLSVENIADGGKVIGAKVVSQVAGQVYTDQILALEQAGGSYRNPASGLSFTGRFAIVRTVENARGKRIDLYIGAGDELSFQGHKLSPGADKKGYLTFNQ